MEINNENKAKFFAQYWDQDIIRVNMPEWLDKTRVVDITTLDSDSFKHFYLQATSLSSITDEDAIEVTKICLDPKEKPLQVLGIINWDWCKRIVVNRVQHINDDETIVEMFISIEYSDCDIKFTWDHSNPKRGTSVQERHCPNVLSAYDYLRSKGYALPYMGISVEDQVKAGWIKLINP